MSKKARFFNNKIIYLDNQQISALGIILDGKSSSSHINLHGLPGCGKTSTMILAAKDMLHSNEHSTILFLVNSEKLKEFIIKQLNSGFHEINPARIAVKTPKDIYIETHGLTPRDQDKETPYYIDPQGLLWVFNGKSDFLTWYKAHHLQQNKSNQVTKQGVVLLPESRSEAEFIYDEFYAMSGYETFEDYEAAIKDKYSLFADETMRNRLWHVYIGYKDHLKANQCIDLVFEPIVLDKNQAWDIIMVDEAPDLSRCQLKSLSDSKHEQIIFSVCDHQYLGNLAPLTQFLHSMCWEKKIKPCDIELLGSHRSPNKSVEITNQALEKKGTVGVVDKHEIKSMRTNPDHQGYARWVSDEELARLIAKNKENAHFVVITPDKFVDEAVKLFSQKKEELTTPGQVSRDQRQRFVFTPEQFKGLEARDVLLYRFFEEDDFFAINDVLSTEQPLDIDVRHNKPWHKLIVALTRNTDRIFFYQPLVHALRYIINPFKGGLVCT